MSDDDPRLVALPGRTGDADGRAGFRPRATRLRLRATAAGARAEVTVAVGEREATGSAEGLATLDGLRRLVADATARAVATLRGDPVAAQVTELAVDSLEGVPVALVRLTGTGADGQPRTGAAEIGDDVRLALVRAVLDACGRDDPPAWWERAQRRATAGGEGPRS